MPGGGSKIQLNSVLLLPVLILGLICLIKTWVIKKMEKYFKIGSPTHHVPHACQLTSAAFLIVAHGVLVIVVIFSIDKFAQVQGIMLFTYMVQNGGGYTSKNLTTYYI